MLGETFGGWIWREESRRGKGKQQNPEELCAGTPNAEGTINTGRLPQPSEGRCRDSLQSPVDLESGDDGYGSGERRRRVLIPTMQMQTSRGAQR